MSIYYFTTMTNLIGWHNLKHSLASLESHLWLHQQQVTRQQLQILLGSIGTTPPRSEKFKLSIVIGQFYYD